MVKDHHALVIESVYSHHPPVWSQASLVTRFYRSSSLNWVTALLCARTAAAFSYPRQEPFHFSMFAPPAWRLTSSLFLVYIVPQAQRIVKPFCNLFKNIFEDLGSWSSWAPGLLGDWWEVATFTLMILPNIPFLRYFRIDYIIWSQHAINAILRPFFGALSKSYDIQAYFIYACLTILCGTIIHRLIQLLGRYHIIHDYIWQHNRLSINMAISYI